MSLPTLSSPDLNAHLSEGATGFKLTLDGRADTPEARERLRAFFAAVDQTLRALRVPKVAVDFNQLTFINSSCFKELVLWLTTVAARPAPEQYRLVFLSNPAVRWQRASLHSLATFATGLVEIE